MLVVLASLRGLQAEDACSNAATRTVAMLIDRQAPIVTCSAMLTELTRDNNVGVVLCDVNACRSTFAIHVV